MSNLVQHKCERCGNDTYAYIISMFNTQKICMQCKRKEQAHPQYQHARDTEAAAVALGEKNFPGIGLPPDLESQSLPAAAKLIARWRDEQHTHLVVTITASALMQELAKEAITIQDTSNLCGLAQRFAEVMKRLIERSVNPIGTTLANHHPIVRLWVDKFAHLSGYYQELDSKPWNAVDALADGNDTEWELPVDARDRAYWEQALHVS